MKQSMKIKIGTFFCVMGMVTGPLVFASSAFADVSTQTTPHHASPAVKAAFAQCRSTVKQGNSAKSKEAWRQSMRSCMANKGFVAKRRSPASQPGN
jgi:hypothetical protein